MSKKKTHEEYLQELKDKNIKVYPHEEYINSISKIYHKCICGEKWYALPGSVIKGGTCGCSRLGSTNKYKEKLISKNILVEPLEKYIDYTTKILHKCICGNEWEATPKIVTAGYKCGCNKVELNKSFYKNKETILYVIKIDKLYKLGITSRDIKRRYSNEGVKYEIIYENKFKNGEEAWEIEEYFKNEFYDKLYEGENIFNYTKNTEIFVENPLSFFSFYKYL